MEDPLNKFMLSLLAYAVQRDMPAEKLCGLSQISLQELRHGDLPVSENQLRALWQNAVSLSGDDLFGLHFGESLQLSALGVVGEIIKTSETVGQAITVASSLAHFITRDFRLETALDEHHFSIQFIPLHAAWQQSVTARQTLDLLMVFVVHELDGLLLKKIIPESVSFIAALSNPVEYRRALRCNPVAGTRTNAISFNRQFWDEPVISSQHVLQQELLQKLSSLKEIRAEAQNWQSRIYHYLMTNSYLGIISLQDVAGNFNMSVRHVQRKLKAEGVSFQQLADEVRKTLAISYLKGSVHPLKEISFMLGYNELSAFNRTFKRWTGITPAAFQKNPGSLS